MEERTSPSQTHCEVTEPWDPHQWDTRNDCEVRQILDRIADKWSLLAIALLAGRSMRFTELRRAIAGISHHGSGGVGNASPRPMASNPRTPSRMPWDI